MERNVKKGHKPRRFLMGDAAQQLARLRGLFVPNAVVSLIGCDIVEATNPTAEDKSGLLLMKLMSEALGGVAVQAGDKLQFSLIPGMEGNVWRCNAHSCWIVPGPSWWGVPE